MIKTVLCNTRRRIFTGRSTSAAVEPDLRLPIQVTRTRFYRSAQSSARLNRPADVYQTVGPEAPVFRPEAAPESSDLQGSSSAITRMPRSRQMRRPVRSMTCLATRSPTASRWGRGPNRSCLRCRPFRPSEPAACVGDRRRRPKAYWRPDWPGKACGPRVRPQHPRAFDPCRSDRSPVPKAAPSLLRACQPIWVPHV